LDLDPEALRRFFDPSPGRVPFPIGHALHLVEPGDGVADVIGVDQRLLSLSGEGELGVVEAVLLRRAQARSLPRDRCSPGAGALHRTGLLEVAAGRLLLLVRRHR